MAKSQKVGRYKSLMRSARFKSRNASERSFRVANARRRHLKRARRSCGEKFANKLAAYYAKMPSPGRKVN